MTTEASEAEQDFLVGAAMSEFFIRAHEDYGMGAEVMWAMLREAYDKRDRLTGGETTFDEFCGALKWRAICEWDI